MRYRREDSNGNYSFGQGDSTFLTNSTAIERWLAIAGDSDA
ncbi:hypothetical protein [Xenorhabdus bovienii]|nr:hypothetical protein [Xenorhabdus bovienii]